MTDKYGTEKSCSWPGLTCGGVNTNNTDEDRNTNTNSFLFVRDNETGLVRRRFSNATPSTLNGRAVVGNRIVDDTFPSFIDDDEHPVRRTYFTNGEEFSYSDEEETVWETETEASCVPFEDRMSQEDIDAWDAHFEELHESGYYDRAEELGVFDENDTRHVQVRDVSVPVISTRSRTHAFDALLDTIYGHFEPKSVTGVDLLSRPTTPVVMELLQSVAGMPISSENEGYARLFRAFGIIPPNVDDSSSTVFYQRFQDIDLDKINNIDHLIQEFVKIKGPERLRFEVGHWDIAVECCLEDLYLLESHIREKYNPYLYIKVGGQRLVNYDDFDELADMSVTFHAIGVGGSSSSNPMIPFDNIPAFVSRTATTAATLGQSFLMFCMSHPDALSDIAIKVMVNGSYLGSIPLLPVIEIVAFFAAHAIRILVSNEDGFVKLPIDFVSVLTPKSVLHLEGLGLGGKKGKQQPKKKPIKITVVSSAPKQKKKSQKKKGTVTVSRMPESVKSYMTSRMHPFHPDALGVRCPDPYRMPTVAYHLNTTLTISSDANGNFALVLLPSPLLSVIDPGWAGVGAATTAMTTATNAGGMNNYGNGMFGLSNRSLLQGLGPSYRVVSWGYCINNIQAQMTGIGTTYMCIQPCTQFGLDLGILQSVVLNATGLTNIMNNYGITTNTLTPANQGMPLSATINTNDLFNEDYYITPPIYDQAAFYQFKDTYYVGALNATQAMSTQLAYTVSTGALVGGGSSVSGNCSGGCSVSMFGTGYPASTKVIEVNIIMHLELTPNTSSQTTSTGIVPTAVAMSSTSIGTTQLVESINNMATSVGPFTASDVASTFAHDRPLRSGKNKDVMRNLSSMTKKVLGF